MPTSTWVRKGGDTFPAAVASDLGYTPSVLTDWDGDADPGNADDAFDQLAERVTANTEAAKGIISFGFSPQGGQAFLPT